MSFLEGEAMTGGYGGADIIRGCAIAVERGEIAVIVGPNGAGKSTAMKALLGMVRLRSGAVRLGGEDITGLSPQDRVGRGMAFVPQTDNVFATLTVRENLEMGAFLRREGVGETMERVFDLFPAVRENRDRHGGRALRRPAPAGGRRPRADDRARRADAGRADGRRFAHRDGRPVPAACWKSAAPASPY